MPRKKNPLWFHKVQFFFQGCCNPERDQGQQHWCKAPQRLFIILISRSQVTRVLRPWPRLTPTSRAVAMAALRAGDRQPTFWIVFISKRYSHFRLKFSHLLFFGVSTSLPSWDRSVTALCTPKRTVLGRQSLPPGKVPFSSLSQASMHSIMVWSSLSIYWWHTV